MTKAFNSSIKKAQDLDDRAFESQLKEKRNWFLMDRNCEVAKQLLSKLIDDEISKDSSVLDGKTWDEILEETFSKREASPFPPPPKTPRPIDEQFQEIEKIIQEIETLSEEDIKNYINPKEEIEIKAESAQQKFDFWNSEKPIKIEPRPPKIATCDHQWIIYEGAGTKPPETICVRCGASKS